MSYYTLLTNIGLAKLANAVALGQAVQWTEMAVGDGNGNPTTPTQAQTALVRERFRAPITNRFQNPTNLLQLNIELVIPPQTGGWNVVEAGIFDADGDMVAVCNLPLSYKPTLPEGSGKDMGIRMIIEHSNVANITILIDPSIVLASRTYVEANFLKRSKVVGGLTNQVLRKKSNNDEDFEWWTPGVSNITVNVVQEVQTLATGQLIVDLATISTNGAAFYVAGARLEPTDYVTNSATRITLARAYPAGTRILGAQNEPHDNAQPKNLLGGSGQMVFNGNPYWITSNGPHILPDATPLTEGVSLKFAWRRGLVPVLQRNGSTTVLELPDGTQNTFVNCDVTTEIELYLNKTANKWEIR